MIFTLTSALTLCAVSASEAEPSYAADAQAETGESASADGTVSDAEDNAVDGEKSDTGVEQTSLDEEKSSPFVLFYEALSEHAPAIMSAFAAIASVILAFCYGKGLLPMLKDALGGMLSAVGSLKTSVSENDGKLKEVSEALARRLEAAEESIGRITELTAALSEIGDGRADVITVMSEQVELLYDVFMQSSLPEYKKERIGERIASMKSRLAAGEADANDA